MIQAALKYLQSGYAVIPINPASKKPFVKFKKYQTELPTETEIKDWWSKWPKANVGLVTGEKWNLLVVDLDKYKKEYSEEIANQLIPDNIITPTSVSPRGGQHLYFNYPAGEKITIDSNNELAIDFRGTGGYIVAPPSVNGNGKKYEWLTGLSLFDIPRQEPPDGYIIYIKKYSLYRDVTRACDNGVTSVTSCDIWKDGERDKNLFHVAHCLTQTKNDEGYILQTLRAIVSSWGESDEAWINAKIKSAMDRQERQERNIQSEVDEFIRVTTGDFSVTNMDKELGCVTKRDMAAARKALSRRKDVTVEKAGTRDGWWRRIDTDIEYVDFTEDQGARSNIILPFDLSDLVEVCEGNIILIAGEYNAGKTTFALNTLQMNKNRLKIRYISSEMKGGEFKARWRTFRSLPESFWLPDEMTEYVQLRNNLPALILPDGLTIVDYLEFRDGDYTQGAEYMRQIHDKLKTGVCIVCNQQKEGARLPRSGDLIMEKPRLAITFRKVATMDENVIGIAEIMKAKNVRLGKLDGKKLKYELQDKGSKFNVLINWGWWK